MRQLGGLEVASVKMEVTEEEEDGDEAKMKRAQAAAERRKKIMAAMQAKQKTFMQDKATLFEETPSGLRDHKQSVCEWEIEEDESAPVCLGPGRSAPIPIETSYTCILCQEEEELSSTSDTLVMCSYVQRSTVLARRRGTDQEASPPVQDPTTFPFLHADLAAAPHTSSCGHVMHAACWQKYFDDVSESERRRYRARHPTSFDVEKQEFLCPLCRSLSNSVVPLIPQYHLLQQPTTGEAPQVQNEESAEGVAAVVEQCDAMETTEELPPSPTQQEPTLTQEEEEDQEGGASGEAMLEVDEDDREAADHTAVATTVTVVSSPSPSSTSSSTTELASAQSVSSDSTFMSVEEGPKETFADTKLCEARSSEEEPNKAQRNPLNINIDFSQWLEALFIALKYRRGISKEPSQPPNSGESQPEDAEPEPESLPTLTRFYTCPLDQVA